MNPLLEAMLPEVILVTVACVLLLMGALPSAGARKVTPVLALLALLGVFWYQLTRSDLYNVLTDQAEVASVAESSHVRPF